MRVVRVVGVVAVRGVRRARADPPLPRAARAQALQRGLPRARALEPGDALRRRPLLQVSVYSVEIDLQK